MLSPLTGDTEPPEVLAARAAEGDHDALACLYDAYIDKTVRIIYMRVRQRQDAEDIAGEVWINITRAIGTFVDGGAGSFAKWHNTISKNAVASNGRWRARRVPTISADMFELDRPSLDLGPAELAERKQESAELAAELTRLSTNHRLVLVLRIIQGYNVAETAAIMGVSETNVKVMQHRALKAMKKRLGHTGCVTQQAPQAYSVQTRPSPNTDDGGGEAEKNEKGADA